MVALFGRHCEVTVGIPGGEARTWSGLRTGFAVDHHLRRRPSPAKVTIYNLNEDSRGFVSQSGQYAWVRAGYDADRRNGLLPVVAQGTITDTKHEHKAVDWVTSLTVSDGGHGYREGVLRRSFRDVPVRDAILAAARAMSPTDVGPGGVGISRLEAQLADPVFSSLLEQVTIDGPARTALDDLLATTGHTWSIQDNELVLVLGTQPLDENTYVLSATSGLLGSPQWRKTKSGTHRPDGLEVKSLLLPMIRPGRLVRVVSRAVTGDFVVREANHEGDTHDDSWYTTLIADPRDGTAGV